MKLSDLTGRKVVDIEGSIGTEHGLEFVISKAILDDGSALWVEGGHDYHYLYDYGDKIIKKRDLYAELKKQEQEYGMTDEEFIEQYGRLEDYDY